MWKLLELACLKESAERVQVRETEVSRTFLSALGGGVLSLLIRAYLQLESQVD